MYLFSLILEGSILYLGLPGVFVVSELNFLFLCVPLITLHFMLIIFSSFLFGIPTGDEPSSGITTINIWHFFSLYLNITVHMQIVHY